MPEQPLTKQTIQQALEGFHDPETGRSKAVQAFRISESQMRSKETWTTFSSP